MSTPRDRVHEAVVRLGDQVRRIVGIPGLEMTLVDLDGHRALRRAGRPPYRRITIDLGEARDVLLSLPDADDEAAHHVIAALVARDVAPVREHADWDVLTARVAWALGKLGVSAERAVKLAVVVVDLDGP